MNTRVSENQKFCSVGFMNHEKHRTSSKIIAQWRSFNRFLRSLSCWAGECRAPGTGRDQGNAKHSAWQHGLVMPFALCTCFTLNVNLVITKNSTAPAVNLSASEYCNGFLHSQSFVNSYSWKMHEHAEHAQMSI